MTDQEYIERFGKTRDAMIADTRNELRRAAKSGNKTKVKELIALLKKVVIGDDVYWANEVTSNYFMMIVMLGIAVILIATTILGYCGVFDFESAALTSHVAVCLAQLAVGVVLQLIFHGEKAWLKYVQMLIICMTVASAHAIFGYSAEMSLVLPVILSTKYLSEKFTTIVSVVSGLFLTASSILTVFMSVSPDLNTVAFAPGTVLEIRTSLNAAVSQQSIDMTAYLKNQMAYSFLPNLMQFVLLSIVCIAIAKWAHKVMMEQAAVSREFARVDTELNTAREIQAHILPNIFPAFPERHEIDLFASMTPAREVGGDFYDYFLVDDDHMALVIADVSGKGMPAALFMMIGKALIKNEAHLSKSPAEILTSVNRQLCDGNDTGLFITAWVGILELSTGKLTAANAGHEYPFVKRRDGEYETVKDAHGLMLGVTELSRYREYDLSLQPGDRLFIYTDGVTEATDAQNNMFGMDNLQTALNSMNESAQKDTLTAVYDAVNVFVGKAPQFDDLTMLGLSYFGTDGRNKDSV